MSPRRHSLDQRVVFIAVTHFFFGTECTHLAAEASDFPFSLSLDLRSKSTPSPLPPQLSFDLRSSHLREGLTKTGLVPNPSAKAILKNQKGRMGKLPPIDRSSSSLRSGGGLDDVGNGKLQRQINCQPLLSHARRRVLSRHGGSKSANGQEREKPMDRNLAARALGSEGRGKRNEESRLPEQNHDGPTSRK
jgi:hypothetical protein